MKARIPKSFVNLPQREKDIISDLVQEQINEAVDREEAEMQKIWLSMACIILHDAFGFGKERCMMFLGNWRKMYRKNDRFKGSADQKQFLDEKIAQIFKGDYPQEFIDSL